jgi:polyisoprenoid-binding protein YceI
MTVAATRAELVGSVHSHDGWPVPDATVTVLDVRGGQIGHAISDDRGTFWTSLPCNGPVTMLVTAAGYQPVAITVLAVAGRQTELAPVVLTGTHSDRLPKPGTWEIDSVHSIMRATARHIGLSRVEGRFTEFAGRIVVGDPVDTSSCEVVIQAASITTGNQQRDDHLRSPDFVDVERFPELTYRSSQVVRRSDDLWIVHGELTIRDIRHQVPLDVRYVGSGYDAWGGTRAAFEATAQLARRDYEMRWNMGLPGGLTMVGPTLRIDLDVQAVLVES